jgi:hypothetical protein
MGAVGGGADDNLDRIPKNNLEKLLSVGEHHKKSGKISPCRRVP